MICGAGSKCFWFHVHYDGYTNLSPCTDMCMNMNVSEWKLHWATTVYFKSMSVLQPVYFLFMNWVWPHSIHICILEIWNCSQHNCTDGWSGIYKKVKRNPNGIRMASEDLQFSLHLLGYLCSKNRSNLHIFYIRTVLFAALVSAQRWKSDHSHFNAKAQKKSYNKSFFHKHIRAHTQISADCGDK